jgi:hypothetical protein
MATCTACGKAIRGAPVTFTVGGVETSYHPKHAPESVVGLPDDEDREIKALLRGEGATLYHGTTRSFQAFDLGKSRRELVNDYYGIGIFLTPSKSIAEKYAFANRNIGFEPSIIDDLSAKNANAGAFLRALYTHGADGWEWYWKRHRPWREDPPLGERQIDLVAFDEHLGVDPNAIGDLAGYIIGSKTKPLGDDSGFVNIFNQSTGAPSWIYDVIDRVGLDANLYRPRIYTVRVKVRRPLVTASRAKARSARSKGYDSVVYLGSGLVEGHPEVAVFNADDVRVESVEVL